MYIRNSHLIPTSCRRLAGAVAATLLLMACSDDSTRDEGPCGCPLRFEVSEREGWIALPDNPAEPALAADCGGSENRCFTLRGDTPADTLFVHASVAEGISARTDGTAPENPELPIEVPTEPNRTDAGGESPAPETRAAPVGGETFHDSFGVVAFAYTGSWNESLTPEFLYDVEVTRDSGWKSGSFWPGPDKHVRFFAYAPYGAEGIVLSERGQSGIPTIAYTVPESVEKQQDLLVAATGEMPGDAGGAAPLAFGHALTAVRFVTGEMLPGRVEQITLKGVYGRAELALDGAVWSGHSDATDFVQTLSATSDGSAGEPITPAEATFMMLPQTLPADAAIEVVYTDEVTQTRRTLTAPIGGGEWPAGKRVVYRLSTSSILIDAIFQVRPLLQFPYNGSRRTAWVDSRATVSRPNDTPQEVKLGWTYDFVEKDGAGGYRTIPKPDWITVTIGPVGETTEYQIVVEPQDSVIGNPHDDALRAATSINTTAGRMRYNLANDVGAEAVQSTANCYVVNAPGHYSLPLVYGNAVKLGRTNRDAYFKPASGDNREYACVNHLDSVITDPYIYRNANCTPADCCLVWQDAEGLVTNVWLSSDGERLEFEVPKATIRQGNAVVAVRDAAQRIMWSWHIWVTDYKLGEGLKWVTNPLIAPAEFLPVNLGWCEPDMVLYEKRSVLVRFRQNGTQNSRTFSVTQEPHEVHGIGNCTFFAYGRKDPIRPVIIDANDVQDKEWYSDNGYTYQTYNENTTVGTVIQHPHIYYGPQAWNHRVYTQWNIISMTSSTTYIKSIYDPTPAGYRVPLNKELSFITANGNDLFGGEFSGFTPHVNSPFEKVEEVKARWGWEFFCYRMKGQGDYDPAGGTIFFPITGMRNLYGGKDPRSSTVPYANYGGCDINQYPQLDLVNIYMGNMMSPTSISRAFYIRPVKE